MPNPPAVPQPLLNQFQSLLSSPQFEETQALALIPDLQKQKLAEEALLLLRQARLGSRWPNLRKAMEEAAVSSREKRAAQWHLDGGRIHLRFRYARRRPLQDLNPAETLALLRQVFRAADLPLALGLGKIPRPLVTLGHPLPIGCEGLEEWADAVLQRRPEGEHLAWLQALNQAAPEGLSFGALEAVPPYATPVLELAREAHWAWPCPMDRGENARVRVAAFLAAASFELEKSGKAEGAKILKKLEVRPLVKSMEWDERTLVSVVHISPSDALNPRKLLGGILGLPPDQMQGLVRLRVVLAEDPRLLQAEKFEPKLKNIFEDAVLLGAGSNLLLVDDDEDEPLILG